MTTFYIEGYNSQTNNIKQDISDESLIDLLGLNEYDFCELSDIPSLKRKIIIHLNSNKVPENLKIELKNFSVFLTGLQEQSKKAFWI